MLKGIEFLLKKSRGFKTSSRAGEKSSVAFSNKVMDTPELPQPIKRHVAPKYDAERWDFKRWFNTFCNSIKYPSPEANASTSPSGGEVLNSVFYSSTFNVILRRYSLLEVPWRRIHNVIANAMSICVASGNKVMDTRLPFPVGSGDKYDVDGLGYSLLRRYTSRNDGASNGEELHRPWCQKILGTGPSMTGARGANSFGRSMIEMLGVLAVIAVLSVGGIAGYSKAMSMYKLNKWYDNLVQMITNVQTVYINQKSYGDSGKNLTSIFVSTGIIPKEILDENNKDILGNTLNIFTSSSSAINGVFRINFYHQLPAGKEAVACCRKLYESSQYFPSMWAVDIADLKYVVCGKAAPKIYHNYFNCQPYDLAKVATECAQCETKSCEMNFIFDNSTF